MSVASRESSRSMFESWSERFALARERLKQRWRRARTPLETNTDVPAADDRSIASFHSEPMLTDEAKVASWDDGQPELKKLSSFALPEQIVSEMEEEYEQERNANKIHILRLLRKYGLSVVVAIMATAILVKRK